MRSLFLLWIYECWLKRYILYLFEVKDVLDNIKNKLKIHQSTASSPPSFVSKF